MKTKTIIHLLSGGLDSVTMLYWLHNEGHRIHCLLFDYGQPHVQELQFAKIHAKRLGLLYTTATLPPLGGMDYKSPVVSFRNGVLLSHAANVAVRAGADTITIGCNKDDEAGFPDCRKSFLDPMNQAIEAAGYDVEICAPFLDKPKSWIARLASDLGVQLHEIWTCYHPTATGPCGVCPACKKLESAIK